MVMATLDMDPVAATWHNPVLKELYGRFLPTGKPKKVALVARMRDAAFHFRCHPQR